MKNIKKEISSIVSLLGATLLATAPNAIIHSTGLHLVSGIAAHMLTGLTPDQIRKRFITIHPNDLNHHIKKLFVKSIHEALNNIYVLFAETLTTKNEKKEAKQLINELQKLLPDILLDSNKIQLEEPEIRHFLYENNNDEMICHFIESQFDICGITEPFKSFLAKNLPAQIKLCFGEGLKDPVNQNAWIAFQRMLIEEIRNDIKNIADTQQSIKEDISDLKFEKSGLSKEQISEIHQLINILNNKKLIEVKIKDSVNKSLTSIENKANEIIQITTKTQLTVEELKRITEKIKLQNRTNHIIIYTLTVCLLVAGAFVVYKLIHQPFTTTVKVYGWESEQHNPLNGKGSIVLILNNKIEKAEINRQGEAIFKSILPEYNRKNVSVYITDTEGEPYYLADSIIKIQRNSTTKVQALLYGLEKLQGAVYDNISGEGIPDVAVTIAGITAKTDENGDFVIEIPIEKQRKEQEIELRKEGYHSKRQTIPMVGKNKYRTILERN